jgi:hypothetical protein
MQLKNKLKKQNIKIMIGHGILLAHTKTQKTTGEQNAKT